MKKETADAICRTLDGEGAEFERRDSYSAGGRPTVGIIVGDIGSFIGAAANTAVVLAAREDEDDGQALNAYLNDISRVSVEGAGSDIIVY